MTGWRDIYAQQFRSTLASFVQYRASMFIWMIWQVMEPLIFLVVWSVVSKSTGNGIGGFTENDFAAYFITLMVVNHITFTWVMYEFEYRVRHGSLSFALLRPIHPIHSDIVANLSSKMITMPVMILIAVFLTLLFKPTFHFTLLGLIGFIPAALFAFIMRFMIEWTLALVAFWTTRMSAVHQGYYVATLFLSGQMAPLALLPRFVQTAATFLPFRWMISFPVEVFLGKLTLNEILTGLGVQLIGIGLAYVFLKLVWRAGVRVYSAVGA